MFRFVLFLLSLFCCSLTFHLSAQNKSFYTIELKVQNEYGMPVNDAYVFTSENNRFIGASQRGVIHFQSQLPNSVTVSHISYQNQRVQLDFQNASKLSGDTLFVQLGLESKSYQLPEVEIQAAQNNLVYFNEKAYVKDYAFYEKTTLLLLGIGNQAILRLLDEGGNSLDELQVSGKKLKLLQDCFRNIHLVSKDSIAQVHFTDSSFNLLQSFAKADYENSLMHCKTSIGQIMVVGFEDEHQQDIRYYTKRDGMDGLKKVKRIQDRKTKSTFNRFDRRFEAMKRGGVSSGSAKFRQQLNVIRETDRNYEFFKHNLSNPLYCPVYNINNTFVLFNHFSDSISFYSKAGNKLHQISMDYHFKENWDRALIQDYFSREVYSVYKQKSRLYVQKIDLNTGQLTNQKIESQHPFPTNLQIRDGKLYYLYQDNQKQSAPQSLFAIDL